MGDLVAVKFWLVWVLVLLPLAGGSARSQPGETRPDIPEIVSFYSPLILPKIVQDVYSLKAYIRGEEFARLRAQAGDHRAMDDIFRQALRLSWNNVYEALLISFLCTMDHRKFGVDLPVVGALLWFPLTSEFPDEFQLRVRALPGALYPDSPRGAGGDRDKLQHFFGSAFLTYVFESQEVAERVGQFVEQGEERFIVDGALDERDARANAQGQEFGLWLLQNKSKEYSVRPSSFLAFVLAEGNGGGDTPPLCRPETSQNVLRDEREDR